MSHVFHLSKYIKWTITNRNQALLPKASLITLLLLLTQSSLFASTEDSAFSHEDPFMIDAKQSINTIFQMAGTGQLTDEQRNNRIEEVLNDLGLHYEHYRDFTELESGDAEEGSIADKLSNMPFEVWMLLALGTVGIDENIVLPLAKKCEALYLPGYAPTWVHNSTVTAGILLNGIPNDLVGSFFSRYLAPGSRKISRDRDFNSAFADYYESAWREENQEMAYAFGSSVVAAPIFEEITFRWGLQEQALRRVPKALLSELGFNPDLADKMPVRVARVVAASYLFAIAHDGSRLPGVPQGQAKQGPGSVGCVPQFLFGLLAGAAYESTGSLKAPIFMHALSNGLLVANHCIVKMRHRSDDYKLFFNGKKAIEAPSDGTMGSYLSTKQKLAAAVAVGAAVGIGAVAYHYNDHSAAKTAAGQSHVEANDLSSESVDMAIQYIATVFLYESKMQDAYEKMYKGSSFLNVVNFAYAPYSAYNAVKKGVDQFTASDYAAIAAQLRQISQNLKGFEIDKAVSIASDKIKNDFDSMFIAKYALFLAKNDSAFLKPDGIDSFSGSLKPDLKKTRKLLSQQCRKLLNRI